MDSNYIFKIYAVGKKRNHYKMIYKVFFANSTLFNTIHTARLTHITVADER